jgi:hypothetical protein
METPQIIPEIPEVPEIPESAESTESTVTEPKPSYVKLAMRNMVRKKGISLKHFFLTMFGLLAALVGLSYLTR